MALEKLFAHVIDQKALIEQGKQLLLSELKVLGDQDLDHDGNPDGKEIVSAIAEIEEGVAKATDGGTKLAKLVEAYRAKYVPVR